MSEIVNLSKDHLIGIVEALQTRIQKIREQNTRSAKKYRAQHRHVVNSIAKRYYERHREDPLWVEKKREKQRLYYQKKKVLKKISEIPQSDS
jgi:iron-sulfur cluster repair protein YtfE (RIC family)